MLRHLTRHDSRIVLGKATRHGSHLVRHGRGAHFSSNGLLLEVAQADVAPHIPVKVQQDGVESHHHPKQLSNVVMRLYLQHNRPASIQCQAYARMQTMTDNVCSS